MPGLEHDGDAHDVGQACALAHDVRKIGVTQRLGPHLVRALEAGVVRGHEELRRQHLHIEGCSRGVVQQALSRIRSGTMKFKRHMDKLVFNVLKNNGTCLDGLALFSASHKVNPADPSTATYSNTTSGALTPNNYDAARVAMMELKAPDGDPVNENPNVLLVAPAKETIARKILEADEVIYSATASDTREFNVFKGRGVVVVSPHLGTAHGGNDDYWYVTDTTDTEDRGLIAQIREEVEFVPLTDLAHPNVFSFDEYVLGMRARHTAAGGNPKKILRRTG